MKLRSAVLVSALNAAYKTLGISATYAEVARMTYTATAGFFLRAIFNKVDSATALDRVLLSFFGSLTPSVAGVAEDATLAFFKEFADNGLTTDEQIISVLKVVSDQVVVTGDAILTRGVIKGFYDPTIATESIELVTSHFKALADQVRPTDDLDGGSTIEDDQEVQFFTTKTETVAPADLFVLTAARPLSDTTSATDTGLLRMQGYSDLTYFAGDYVGLTRTFT
tara:strand:+ start:583 stop:1254 length:672 start_codon:yes stop_codon:yes gene_type:complete